MVQVIIAASEFEFGTEEGEVDSEDKWEVGVGAERAAGERVTVTGEEVMAR